MSPDCPAIPGTPRRELLRWAVHKDVFPFAVGAFLGFVEAVDEADAYDAAVLAYATGETRVVVMRASTTEPLERALRAVTGRNHRRNLRPRGTP